MLVTLFVSLYTSRLVLQALGVIDFGIYNIVGGIVLFFSFLNGTLSGSISRFFTFELGKANLLNLKKVFNTSLSIQIVLGIVILVLLEIFGSYIIKNKLVIPVERVDAALISFHFIIFNFLCGFIKISYEAVIIAHEKMNFFAYFSIGESLMKLLLTYTIVYLSFDKLILYSILLSALSLLSLLGYCLYCRKKFLECHYNYSIDKKFLKEILSFSFLDIYGSVCYMIGNQGVGFVLNVFWGPVLNAANGVGIQVRNSLSGFSNNIVMATRPQIVMSFSREEIHRMLNLVKMTCKYSYILLYLFSLPVLIETDFILNLWLKNLPEYSVEFTRISLIYILIASLFYPIIIAVQATGKMKHISLISGSINLITIPLMYLIALYSKIPYYSYCAILITILLVSCSDLLILRKYIKLFSIRDFSRKVILPCIILTLITLILPLLIRFYFSEGFARFCFNTIFIICEILFICYFFVLEIEIKKLFIDKFTILWQKIKF